MGPEEIVWGRGVLNIVERLRLGLVWYESGVLCPLMDISGLFCMFNKCNLNVNLSTKEKKVLKELYEKGNPHDNTLEWKEFSRNCVIEMSPEKER